MRKTLVVPLLLILICGCRPPRQAEPTRRPSPVLWQTASPRSPSATWPAPTRGQPPTASPTSQMTPNPQPTATPTPLPVAANDLNLLLLGSDQRIGREETWRTDSLIVVAIRPRTGLVAMLSVPRDLWVDIPGHGPDRINVADYLGETSQGPGGGPALVAATLKENLGIPIDASARIHYQGLARIIDALGGINVTSDRAYDEWFWDETAPDGVSHMVVVTGTQRMDGRLALQYARARHGTSDFDRSRRQQQILLALRDAAMRPEVLPRLPALLMALSDTVETDLKPGQILSLLGLALRLKPEAFRGRVFDSTMVRDWVTPGGAQVLLPNRARIEQVWRELTSP